ncbi:type II secretion system F family protein [Marinobacter salinisoli]|uniref:Type II secretion system F family protein n=1 Tax=Marinobacter salinisoli TaxID=2769486 RepID=A0ABX7MRM6_9GAMM|nr:type II secretion system F family protein [Marinobacter salinisoli]QSP94963.1 type II secretion system F family protein [Marinobacter salinisoli]
MSVDLMILLSVFVAVILLSQALMLPVYRPQRGDTRYIKERLEAIREERGGKEAEISVFRKNRLEKASTWGRQLEALPFIANITLRLEQSGSDDLGYRYIAKALLLAAFAAAGVFVWKNSIGLAAIAFVVIPAAFYTSLNKRFAKRIDKIEEQFPEALGIIGRSLQAGHAFPDAIKMTYEELEGPIAEEFYKIFNDINYRKSVKAALLFFVERVPTVSAMAFSSAVIVQKETGGNLAENVKNLSKIIRQRFAFKRKVKTLSAEGRMSAWVLVLMPIALFAFLYLTSPDYAQELTGTEQGRELLLYGFLGMAAGVFWLGRLIRLDV